MPEVSACLLTPSAHYARTLSLGRVTPIHSEGWFRRCTVQVRPEPSAKVERILFVLHVLQLLLGLGVVQPFSSLVSTCCWDAFLAVSAIYHFYKVDCCRSLTICIYSR